MKRFLIRHVVIAAFAVVGFFSATVCLRAQEPCQNIFCEPCTPAGCAKKPSLWYCDGYVESGLYVNEYGQKNRYTDGYLPGPDWWSGNTGMLQNTQHADYQLNQLFVAFGKKLDTKRGWDVGGRMELMYGTDAAFMQSAGLERATSHGQWVDGDYFTAISQMYAEVGYKNFSVKVGKFYTTVGYESINSPDRFFYSLSHTYGLNPATHSGVLATWLVNKKIVLFGGWVNGEEKFFDTSKDNAFLGGGQYTFNERAYMRYSIFTGVNKQLQAERKYTVQSIVFGLKPTKKWDYTFEWIHRDLVPDQAYIVFVPRDVGGRYGINQELIYRINEKWAVGFRFEWIYGGLPPHMFDGRLLPAYRTDDNKYGFTLAANWTPTQWLIIKPDIRYDKYEHLLAYNWTQYRPEKGQLSGGFSTIVKF